MIEIKQGFRSPIAGFVNETKEIIVETAVSGTGKYRYSCYCACSDNRLPDERYKVSVTQRQSPGGEIVQTDIADGAMYIIKLWKLPDGIHNIFFTVSIEDDCSSSMSDISRCTFTFGQKDMAVLRLNLRGSDFHSEDVVLLAELNRDKRGWQISIPATGYRNAFMDVMTQFTEKETEVLMLNSTFRNNALSGLPVWAREKGSNDCFR